MSADDLSIDKDAILRRPPIESLLDSGAAIQASEEQSARLNEARRLGGEHLREAIAVELDEIREVLLNLARAHRSVVPPPGATANELARLSARVNRVRVTLDDLG